MDDVVAIVDYGVGNLFNIQRAFASLGAKAVITDDQHKILGAAKMLLPGVGAFEAGMNSLEEHGLVDAVRQFAASGRPILGICLGMQMLMSRSHENGLWKGLDIISGEVLPIKKTTKIKVPQIGWNSLRLPERLRGRDAWRDTVLAGLGQDPAMYFIHSYYVSPAVPSESVAETEYGDNVFCSVVKKGNVTGCQFHPERSSEAGLKILRNFAFGGK